ncbi:glycoside hydrolase family 5 protein [Aliifodinibius sp. S!AR15-10]|uniref:glycoside hydrolase family 5 protein n=1 Tax=Aliifodinibius sp. S!AR15-10 TaxID=2950437 RepID=UPI00285959FA|nr:glycoside hydrolase family 5 protein [Aliifodinibius sp. S!AR15-10]MDR8392045.1 glycoside hydrolase family 5 protein [Aliifodinibius sp. S!AR15-10]
MEVKSNSLIYSLLLALLALAVLPSCSNSQELEQQETDGPVQPKPEHPVDPFERNRALGKGVNLGNALEAPKEGDWGMRIEEEYIQLIKDAGFDAVRIPTRWNAHAQNSKPYTIESTFFDRVDQVIEWCLERDLMVILNIHHYNELMEEPEEHKERFLAIWKQVSEHYHNTSNDLLFEPLNEPHANLSAEIWNRYLREAIDVIRESNPYRTLVVGTAPWGGIGGLQDLSVPYDDRNIIVTVHYYNPFQFTHQGASWAGDEAEEWLGTTWTATKEQKEAVRADFDTVKNWADTHNRPIYLGEFGAYSAAPQESRESWTTFIRNAAEERNFSWSYWEFGAGFGIYDREKNQWRDGLLKALVPDSPELRK